MVSKLLLGLTAATLIGAPAAALADTTLVIGMAADRLASFEPSGCCM